jgi:adenylate cyclase
MAKEIERKFLITGTVPVPKFEKFKIKQGYLCVEKGKQVRVRIYKDKAAFCIKYTDKLIRDEFEYPIPMADAKVIYSKCKTSVEKIRTSFKIGDETYDFDVFPNGMSWMEVEFKSIKAMKKWEKNKPSWLGKEITGVRRYSNITLAKKNLKFSGKK